MIEWEKFLVPCDERSEGCQECTDGVQNKGLMRFFSARESFKKRGYEREKAKVCDCFVTYEGEPTLYAVEILAGQLTESELEDKARQLDACRNFAEHYLFSQYTTTKQVRIRCILVYAKKDRRLNERQQGRTKAQRLARKHEIVLMDYESYKMRGLNPPPQ